MQTDSRNPSKEAIEKSLTPRMRKMYRDDVFVITIYKAFPYISQLLEEGQRSRVSESNLDTIAPVLLAINFDLKLLELFADRGEYLAKAIQAKNTKNTPE